MRESYPLFVMVRFNCASTGAKAGLVNFVISSRDQQFTAPLPLVKIESMQSELSMPEAICNSVVC